MLINKKNIFYYLFVFLTLKLIPQITDAQSNTLIKGKIISNKVEEVQLIDASSNFHINKIIASSTVSQDSSFEIKLELSSPKVVRLFNINIWISPEDSIYLESDGDKNITLVKGKNRSNYLFYSDLNQHIEEMHAFDDYCGSLPERLKKLTERKIEQGKFLDDYQKKNKITQVFNKYLKIDFEYEYLLKKIAPYIWCTGEEVEKLRINLEKFNNDEAFVTNNYRTALRFYFDYLTNTKVRIPKKYSKKKLLRDWSILDANFIGKSRDALRVDLLKKWPKRDSLKTTLDLLLQIAKEDLTYPQFEESINEIYSTYHIVDMPFSDKLLNTTLKDKSEKKVTFKDILNRHKEKVILIDFWASWCSPCQMQMPHLITLVEKLDTSNVAIIYFSIDKDIKYWKEAISKQKSDKEHYLLGMDYYHPVFNFFMPSAIPRYVVINKKMNLVDYRAPMPSKGIDLYQVIKEILQKKEK